MTLVDTYQKSRIFIVYNSYPRGARAQGQELFETFPLNAWYAAARDVEVATALFPRRIIDKMIEAEDAAQRQVAE
jgi:hypothetical protein